jgi:hypothetical protein
MAFRAGGTKNDDVPGLRQQAVDLAAGIAIGRPEEEVFRCSAYCPIQHEDREQQER